MNLRKLELKDAPLMLEWMHDPDVVQNMQADFAHKTLSDCENFIRVSHTDDKNLHLAVVDDNNTYMGTVSLKNIENDAAEFANIIMKNTISDVIIVKQSAVEQIVFLYCSSSFSKNIRYIASYIPMIASALPKLTTVFDKSLIP